MYRKTKLKDKIALNRLKFKTVFFIYIHDPQFFNKLIASNVMNNTRIINIFNSNNSNIAYNKTQNRQIMTTIVYIILKFESMIKKPIMANIHALLFLLLARSTPSPISILS